MGEHWGRLLAALIATSVPVAPATAQQAMEHASVYSAPLRSALAAAASRPRSPMPTISPKRLPRAALLRSGGPPAVLAHGAAAGSASGGASDMAAAPSKVMPEAFGAASELAIAPYSASRASATKLGRPPTEAAEVAVTSYPWRAAGKLYFKIDGIDYVCTASLIKPGLLLTAGHCVFEFGRKSAGWHTDFVFAPAQYDIGQAPPYGTWSALSELVLAPYFFGTDTCVTQGVVCNNDIAIITLAANSARKLPGTVVGWYGYGWGGYSSVLSFGGVQLSSITQLGYPVAFDSGMMLERNDGVGGLWTSGLLKNTVLGSALTGGSSGGPWLVNFGAAPTIDVSEASLGTSPTANVVIGVTSWGYSTVGTNTQGASFFGPNKEYPASSYRDSHNVDRGSGNIGYLVRSACNVHFDHC